MIITINHDEEQCAENYSLKCCISISDDATAENAVAAFSEALSIEGYTDYSIIDALVKVASDVAYNTQLEKALKDSISNLIEEWKWHKDVVNIHD